MTLPKIDSIESGKSILFLGAGFSAEAHNILGDKIKDVNGLIGELLKSVNINSSDGYDLDAAAQEFLENFPGNAESELTKLIHGNFSSKSYTDAQRIIVCQPWYRIYTTNYDNVVENIYADEGKPYTEKTAHDPVEPPIGCTQLIHIYGSIKNISPAEFHRSFLLTETQRDSSPFLKSAWYRRFNDDVLSSRALIFVGFSMSDIDLRRVLGALPKETLNKVHFITWSGEKKPILTRLARFGQVHSLGTSGFATYLGTKRTGPPLVVSSEPPDSLHELTYISQSESEVSAPDILSLLISGDADCKKMSLRDISNQPGSYLIPRSQGALARAANAIIQSKPILIHGDIGNGKSIFTLALGYKLHTAGYRVFTLRKEPEDIGETVSFLQSVQQKSVIILDDILKYPKLSSAITGIGSKDISVLGTVRSNALDISRHTIEKRIGPTYVEINLNAPNKDELEGWIRYLNENGLWGNRADFGEGEKLRHLQKYCGGQLRDLILDIYSRGALHRKVEELLVELVALDSDFRNIAGLSALLTMCNFQDLATFANLSELVDSQKVFEDFREEAHNRGLIGLISMDRGDVIIRSPALAQFIVRRVFGLKKILEISYTALKYINSYLADEPEFASLGKTLLKYSTYGHLVLGKSDTDVLEGFYDRCRILTFAQSDPLFWVQRSICSMKSENFDLAEDFVKTSYATARKKNKFDTYQIDNHFARLNLTMSLCNGVSSGGIRELAASSLLQGVLTRKSDELYHPLSVMRLFYQIAEKYLKTLDSDQRMALISAIDSSIASVASAGPLMNRFRQLPELEKLLKTSRLKLVNIS